jgi:hypothetical protein
MIVSLARRPMLVLLGILSIVVLIGGTLLQ